MYYGLEACPVNKSQTKSFQYVVNCCFGKILNARSKEDVEFCTQMFNFPSVDLTVTERKVKFLTKYCHHSLNGSSDSVNGDLQLLWG